VAFVRLGNVSTVSDQGCAFPDIEQGALRTHANFAINTPGLEIAALFRGLEEKVLTATDGKQSPGFADFRRARVLRDGSGA
jgi:hypothetical protein